MYIFPLLICFVGCGQEKGINHLKTMNDSGFSNLNDITSLVSHYCCFKSCTEWASVQENTLKLNLKVLWIKLRWLCQAAAACKYWQSRTDDDIRPEQHPHQWWGEGSISHFKRLLWVIISFDVRRIKIELKLQIDKSFMHTMIKSHSRLGISHSSETKTFQFNFLCWLHISASQTSTALAGNGTSKKFKNPGECPYLGLLLIECTYLVALSRIY